jgi:hypothetical protein
MNYKKILYALALFVLIQKAFSQSDLDKLMVERIPNYYEIQYNCKKLIQKYYKENKADSVLIILNYWETNSGVSESLIRTKILWAILNNNFNEAIYNEKIIDYVTEYASSLIYILDTANLNNAKPMRVNMRNFDKLTLNIASSLLNKLDTNSLEYLFCKLYTGSEKYFFSKLRSNSYNNTKLKAYYLKEVNYHLNQKDLHWNMTTGIWIPTGKAKILGNHPTIGMGFGMRYKKMIYSAVLNFILRDTPHEYTFMLNDSIHKTNYFFGLLFGLQVERDLIRSNNSAFRILGGIAYDGFDAMETNTQDQRTDNDDSKSIDSFNVNLGLGYNYNFKAGTCLGLNAKYNFVNYKNPGGTNLSGNTIQINLVFGGFSNERNSILRRNQELERLEWKLN